MRICLSLMLLLSVFAFAQNPKPDTCRIVWNTQIPANPPTATLIWNGAAPSITSITFRTGKVLFVEKGRFSTAGGIGIELDPMVPPEVGFKEAAVDITYLGETTPVEITCPIYTADQWKATAFDRLKEFATVAKGQEQKNVFAGLNVADPSGGRAEGNAELHLNGGIGTALRVSTNLRKSSAEKADAKQFDIGVTSQWQHLFVSPDVNTLLRAGATANPAAVEQASRNLQKQFWLAAGIEAGGRLEGEAMNFNVTNAVVDIPLQIASRTKQLGASNGWIFVRLIPAGVEAGKNLRSEDETNPKYTIARYKAGASVGLSWKASNPDNSLLKRITFECSAIDRYLFLNETAYNKTVKKAVTITSGNQYYVQADLKFFLADTPQGSYGFRVSLVRGALPPVFSYTHTFIYGFVFESKDKNSTQKAGASQ